MTISENQVKAAAQVLRESGIEYEMTLTTSYRLAAKMLQAAHPRTAVPMPIDTNTYTVAGLPTVGWLERPSGGKEQ